MNVYLLIAFLLILISFLIVINKNYSYAKTLIFGVSTHLTFCVIGAIVFKVYNQKPYFFCKGRFVAILEEVIEEKPNSYQSVLQICSCCKEDSVFAIKEKVMVYFAKTDRVKEIKPGDFISFDKAPQIIRNNNNPFEFDYKAFLARKKIYRCVYLPQKNWCKIISKSKFTLKIFSERIRQKLLSIYKEQNFDDENFNVLAALTLGYKRGLDPGIKKTFSNAGAMHILAVSGLHVGIVFFIISIILGVFQQKKYGKFFYILLSLTVLWSFAFITGLSPSVNRAATMLSFVVIGKGLKRQQNIYNSLAASAFILLLVNPNNLFEVGFQLSYAAVFGIVFLQPFFKKIYNPNDKLLKYSWELLFVSISAQMATFPISVFCFNQVPVYFWISNFVVIPAATLLIPLAIVLLVFSWCPFLVDFIAEIIDFIIWFMIHFLKMIEKFPCSVVEITFSRLELVFIIGSVISLFMFLNNHNAFYIKSLLICSICFLSISFICKIKCLNQKQIIVYNHPNQLIVQLVSGRNGFVISTKPCNKTDMTLNMIKNTVRNLKIKNIYFYHVEDSVCNQYFYLKKNILLFDDEVILLDISNKNIIKHVDATIAIGCYSSSDIQNLKPYCKAIVSLSDNVKKYQIQGKDIFYIYENGAFQKKW